MTQPSYTLVLTCTLPSLAPVAEIAARQIGDIQCNVDRLAIVGALGTMQSTLKDLATQASR